MRAALFVVATLAVSAGPLPTQEPGARPLSLPELERFARGSDSNDALLHYQLGMEYWDRKQWDRAEASFRSAITVAPSYADAYLALSLVPVRRGEGYWKERARGEGEEKVAEVLRQYAGYYRRAFLLNPLVDLKVLGKFENEKSALVARTREGKVLFAIPLEPWWSRELSRGVNEFRGGKYRVAYDRLTRLAANKRFGGADIDLPADLLWYLGLAAAHVGNFDQAIRELGILTGRAFAAERDTVRTEGWLPFVTNDYRFIMATLMYLGNRHDQAIPTFQRALEFDLGLYVAHVQLARMYEAQGRLDAALTERRLALDVNQDDPDLLVDLASTLLRMNRLAEAGEPLARAAALNPRDPRIPYLQGLTARAWGDPVAAREALTRFVAIAPSRFAEQKAEVRRTLAELP